MKTTDSVMREFDEKFVVVCPDKKNIAYGKRVLNPIYPEEIEKFLSHSLAEARREEQEKTKGAYYRGVSEGAYTFLQFLLDKKWLDVDEDDCLVLRSWIDDVLLTGDNSND